MSDLPARQTALVQRLRLIEDPHERLVALMARAKKWPTPITLSDDLLVPGCQSRVWLHLSLRDGLLHLPMQSDAPMVAGLVALHCELYEGATPAEAQHFTPTLLDALGLTPMITPTRLNGLNAVCDTIRKYARLNSKGG